MLKPFAYPVLMCFLLPALAGADIDLRFEPEKHLDGTAGVPLPGTERLDLEKGVTLIAVARHVPSRRPASRRFGTLFHKPGEFIFALRDRRPYFVLPNAGGIWNYYQTGIHADKNRALPENDNAFHHYALTLHRYVEPDQGIDYTEAKLYLDGSPVGGRRYDRQQWKSDGGELTAGGVRPENDPVFSPKHWNFPGDLAAVRVLHRAMTEEEIQKDVLADNRLKPGFPVPAPLTPADEKLLTAVPDASPRQRALLSALRNAAAAGNFNWKSKTASGASGVFVLPGKDSALTVLADDSGGGARVFSWFDHRTGRELLAWHNPFFELIFQRRGQEFRISGNDPALKPQLVAVPRKQDGDWSFSIAGKHRSSKQCPFDFTWRCDYRFHRDRLEYSLRVDQHSESGRLAGTVFPALRFNAFTGGGDTLLVPIMSGVEYPDAAAGAASYLDTYPRGRASLQMGAYYDRDGGIWFAAEDPRARVKTMSFSAGKETLRADFEWPVAFTRQDGPNSFNPQCNAGIELFRGNWYDAGLIYREMLRRIQAPWWRPELPETDTPQWFRDNTIWIGRWLAWQEYPKWRQHLDQLRRWKEYVGTPGQAVHLYSWCGRFTRDWPHNPVNPDFVDRTRALQAAGYRVMPYINGRIWEEKDHRDEDWRFTRIGLPACLRTADGRPSPEPYGTTMFRVICPATRTFASEMDRECDSVMTHGADGVYLDQIGAGTHYVCYSLEHGHPAADPDAWYMGGHRPLFMRMRGRWKQKFPEGITAGEDISEATVGILDGGLTWRWMYNGQVPLFPLIYSGRAQMFGQSWGESERAGGDDRPAAPAKLTSQIFNGQQLGWFGISYIITPDMHDIRVLIKQYAHLRVALLDFFNSGIMARPPRFREKQTPVSRIWGRQGTSRVTTEPLLAAAWELRGAKVIMAANTDSERHRNLLESDVPAGTLRLFHSDGQTEDMMVQDGKAALPLDLPPRGFVVAVAPLESDEGQKQAEKLAAAFKVIAAAPEDPDPFFGKKQPVEGRNSR